MNPIAAKTKILEAKTPPGLEKLINKLLRDVSIDNLISIHYSHCVYTYTIFGNESMGLSYSALVVYKVESST